MNPIAKNFSRRRFIQTSTAALAVTPSLISQAAVAGTDFPLKGRLYKTLKIGMVSLGKEATLTDRFKAAKAAGFGAIELDCPGHNPDDVKKAIDESGLPVDGSVCAQHWKIKHTDPDPEVRAKALSILQAALRETKAVGGHTVLLVVGHGDDGPESEIWERSVTNIMKAVPLAAELGVAIAIENVWNKFCYKHDGDEKQTADKFIKYVDAFNSPFVGMQFDIGNHWKYGSMGDWIRQLNKRIIKLDVKGFSRAENKFTRIGEGDLDFADVRKALTEINFYGWCAAEVSGGNQEQLAKISAEMDQVFGLI